MNLVSSEKLVSSGLRTVKCSRCFHYDVSAMCHHCGRFLCKKCTKWAKWYSVDRALTSLKPRLGEDKLRRGAHCQDCFHQEIRILLIIDILGILTLAGLILLLPHLSWIQVRISIVAFALLIGGIAWLVYLWQRRNLVYPLGFPLFAKMKITTQEQVSADFNIIADRPYLLLDPTAEGEISVTLTPHPDDVFRLENAHFRKIPSTFLAGFIGLENLSNATFHKRSNFLKWRNLLAPQLNIDLSTFKQHCHQPKTFSSHISYQIDKKALKLGAPNNKRFPFWIKVRRANGGYRLEIMFEIMPDLKLNQAKSDLADKDKEMWIAAKPMLESFTLHLDPISPEKVNWTNGHFDRENRIIRWHRKPLDVKPVFSLFVVFQEILQNDLILTAEYEIMMHNWTISKLHVAPDVQAQKRYMVRPINGLRLTEDDDKDSVEWLKPTIEHKTKITGTLTFNTSLLLSQQVEMASDLSIPDQQREIRGQETLYVAPTYQVINCIIKELTRYKILIKSVTEVPGQIIESEVGSRRARYWNIEGKYYLGETLHPINLYLLIAGDGLRTNRSNQEGGLSLDLTLRSYTELGDTSTPEHLKYLYNRLTGIIKIAAYKGRQIEHQGRRTLIWKMEQNYEQQIQMENDGDPVAVILTAKNGTRTGYVFHANGHNGSLKIPSDIAEQTHLIEKCINQFATVETDGQDWLDKWELMRILEDGV